MQCLNWDCWAILPDRRQGAAGMGGSAQQGVGRLCLASQTVPWKLAAANHLYCWPGALLVVLDVGEVSRC